MGPKKKKGPAVDPAVALAEEKRIKMADEAEALRLEVAKEEKEITQAQLNKFQLHRNWALDKERQQKVERELRKKDAEIDNLKARQLGEVLELKKKLKDYMLDLQEEVVGEAIRGETLSKQAQDMHRDVLTGMRTDLRSMKQTHKERDRTRDQMMLHLRREHDRACYDLRRDSERQLREMREQFDHDVRVARGALDAQRKIDVAALEERKRAHTARVMAEHAKSLKTIKSYFVDITHNNLEKIRELKAQVTERRQKEEMDQLNLRRLAKENKRMSEPLKRGKEDLYHLRDALEKHEAEKEELRQLTAQLLVEQDDITRSSWEAEVLTLEREQLEKNVKDLTDRYLAAAAEVDQKCGFERLLLERRVKATKQEIATRETQLHRVLTDVARVQPGAKRQIVGSGAPEPLAAKREELHALTARFEALDETYQAMLAAVRSKLGDYGVDPVECGFEPHASLTALNEYCAAKVEAAGGVNASANAAAAAATAALLSGTGMATSMLSTTNIPGVTMTAGSMPHPSSSMTTTQQRQTSHTINMAASEGGTTALVS